jgi:hypothetical protein
VALGREILKKFRADAKGLHQGARRHLKATFRLLRQAVELLPENEDAEAVTDRIIRRFYRKFISEFSSVPLRKLLSPARRKKSAAGRRREDWRKEIAEALAGVGPDLRESMRQAYEEVRRNSPPPETVKPPKSPR